MAGVSTASLGKHDQRLPNEQQHERTLSAKRQKFAPVTESGSAEASRSSAMVDSILRKRGTELINIDKAVGQAEASARAVRHAEKQSQQSERPGSSKRSGKGGKPAKGGKSRYTGAKLGSGPGRPTGKQGKGVSKRGRK